MTPKKEEKAGSLGSELQNIISKLKKGHVSEKDMAGAWKAAAGARAFRHTKPVTLKKARLVVNVDGSGWLYELTLKKREILKKLEEKLKPKKIREIKFRIGEIK